MTGFPGSPQTARGALIGIDPENPLASVVIFQYNPDEMTRTLQARAATGAGMSAGARDEALRLTGAPIENITLAVEIDASDQLESGDALATTVGIYPQLSSLEMLLYPKSALVIANTALSLVGTIELVPALAPLTLLVWNIKRVLPVRLTQFSIVEQASTRVSIRFERASRLACGCCPTATCPSATRATTSISPTKSRRRCWRRSAVRRQSPLLDRVLSDPCHWERDVQEPTSRYITTDVATTSVPDGTGGLREVRYLRRRFPPPPSTL